MVKATAKFFNAGNEFHTTEYSSLSHLDQDILAWLDISREDRRVSPHKAKDNTFLYWNGESKIDGVVVDFG